MIQVLQNWNAVDDATRQLHTKGLPTHITVQKNWDQWLLYQTIAHQPEEAEFIDLGCGDCCTLNFLSALKFTNLHGIDLHIKPATGDRPYHLHEGDMTQTPFADASYDVALSISVIEHGVDLAKFFQEAYRILRPKGQLFVTTDYWEEKIPVEDSIQPFGLFWKIFSRSEIQNAIALAIEQGFQLEQNDEIPDCIDKPVSWYNKDYTFIALTFRKP